LAITEVTVTGTFTSSGGGPATGSVSFQLTLNGQATPISDGSSLIVSPDIVAALVVGGSLVIGGGSLVLYANDDATTVPPGTEYAVAFDIDGQQWTKSFVLPHASPTFSLT
jgi:hypothetical protein